MERGFSPQTVKSGANVHVLFYEESQPRVLSAQVGSLTPLGLTTKDSAALLLKPAMRSILVTEENGTVAKAECHVQDCQPVGDEWHVEVNVTAWEEVDRRRYPRHPIEIPIRLRLVLEDRDQPEFTEILAVTKDISLGGMLVSVGEDVQEGCLVEIHAALRPKEYVRVLAIVVRSLDEGHIGLEFLDFVGGARYAMHGFLSDAA